jgi:Xaa-Pro aminopeptidase
MRDAIYLDFPLEEYAKRFNKIQNLLVAHQLDGILLTNRDTVEYLSGFRVVSWRLPHKAFWLVVPLESEPILIVDNIHEYNAQYSTWVEDIRLWGIEGQTSLDLLTSVLHDLNLRQATIGAEFGSKIHLHMSIEDYEEVRRRLPDITFINAESLIGIWQMVKSPLEIDRIRKACEITCRSIEKCFTEAEVGMTEYDLLSVLITSMLKDGAEDPINATNRGSLALQANRGLQLNPSPVTRKIEVGDLIRIDGGGIYRSYCADMSRNAILAKEPRKELVKAQDACKYVLDSTFSNIKPGITSAQITQIAEKALQDVGFQEKRRLCMDRVSVEKGSMIGHGLGFQHPEAPYITPSDKTVWETGMVGAIEFGLGQEETGFCDLEDDFLVTDKGCELLTPLCKDIYICGR